MMPYQIGRDQTCTIVGGDSKVYEKAESILKLLAPASRYVGEDPGAAEILDHAQMSVNLGAFVGVVQGAALCEAGGASLKDYRELLNPTMDLLVSTVLLTVETISDNDLPREAGKTDSNR